ncbi:MAG: DUF5320 domain-containing protein [Candidatus Cloacimonetes bacterium]|nr:DUF5320 domain-containing protein [Candidatus Cloacimonadota bacterium]
MPYGDGTGPEGRGKMTGRQAGYCTGNDRPGRFERGFSGLRKGRGGGLGRGFCGFAARCFPAEQLYEREPVAVPENDILKQQQSWLKNQLDNITRRISELNSEESKK